MKPKTIRSIALPALLMSFLLGLFSRSNTIPDHTLFGKYGGDTFWAALVFWGVTLLFPRQRISTIVNISLLISYSIEFLQLYKAPWIETIRSSTIGALVLGHDFVLSDIFCYTVGIIVSACIRFFIQNRERSLPTVQEE